MIILWQNIVAQKRHVKKLVLFACAVLLFLPLPIVKGDCFGVNEFGMKDLEIFASQWLSECAGPSWCFGADVDQNQLVNFMDFSKAFGSANPLVLVDNGVCNVSITRAQSSTSEAYAALQLQNAFAFATGLTPAINPSSPASIQIKLGIASQFSSNGVGDSSDQAYTIRRSLDGNIELVGNSQAAILWAVTDFCEKVLHVSWPIADGNMVLEGGSQSRIEVGQLCVITSPDFSRRGWILGQNQNGYGYENGIDDWMSHNRQSITTVPYLQLTATDGWSPYDRLVERGIEPDTTNHSFWWLVSGDEYFATHPEYFPLIDGQRVCNVTGGVGTQLCLSNVDVQNIVYNKARTAFRAYPGYPAMKCFGIVPNDAGTDTGWCQCSACCALDGNQAGTGIHSNRLVWFVNQIANRLAVSCPGKYVGTLAYNDYREAPDINVAPNVFITFCTGGRNLMRKLTDPTDSANAEIMQDLNGWLSKSSNVSLWEYYYYSGIEKCPAPFSHTLSQEFGDLKALGVKGITPQTVSWWWPGLRLPCYTFARATWDTSLTFDEILTDYCSKRYGPAASLMNSYHSAYENILSQHVPVLMVVYGAGEQYIPNAFTDQEISMLDNYLTDALNTATASGTLANTNAVLSDKSIFDKMCGLRVDPATLPGIGSNIVPNPGAESGQSNWSTHTFSPEYSFSIPTDGGHSGSQYLKIECTGTPLQGQSRWYQESIPIQNGHKYAIRFWVRASGGAWGNFVGIFGSASSVVEIGAGDSNDQWVQVVCPEVTATGDILSIYLQSCGLGVMCYDDIFVAELP